MKLYRDDLAYIHDAGFGDFARAAAPFVLGELARAGILNGSIVDLGCGSGIWARLLVDAGYDVLGLDISPAMIRIARERVPEATFRVGSFSAFDPPECGAVTALGESLAYLFDEGNTRRALWSLCRRVYQALRPGGLFVFDLREPGTVPGGSYELFQEGDDWAVLCRVEEDRRRGLLTRHLTTFRKVGDGYRRDREIHRLRLYRAAEVAGKLRRIGFKARIVRSFGAARLAAKHTGFVARRPVSRAERPLCGRSARAPPGAVARSVPSSHRSRRAASRSRPRGSSWEAPGGRPVAARGS